MSYYDQEHPDYYTRETEMCDQCEEEFPTHNGIDFYCEIDNKKTFNFCCEKCMCNFFIPFFDEAGIYENGITDLVKDYEFKCSHPKIFDLEWENYYDNKRNQMF